VILLEALRVETWVPVGAYDSLTEAEAEMRRRLRDREPGTPGPVLRLREV
jgi:hypothetical protein